MVAARDSGLRRPSGWWLALAIFTLALAVTSAVVAWVVQREATKPVGEGVVFVNDARTADEIVREAANLDVGVRMARNALEVEAVSIMDDAGVIMSSTSGPSTGRPLSSALLRSAAEGRRFTALASPVSEDIWLDGVVAWPAGSVLYQVVSPSASAEMSLLVHYDVASLLSRRTPPGTLQTQTVELLVLAGALVLMTMTILFGRGRAARRHRLLALESELLRKHSDELKANNEALEVARNAAEEALALAEEKIRIRSEFVLMINHELRTPLTSVVTGADLIRTTEMSESERASLLDLVVSDGQRLLEIVDQILAVAKIENRGLSKELDDVAFDEVCRVVSEAHPGAPSPVTCDDLTGTTVRTDTKALRLVVASLVDNALTHGAEHVSIVPSREPQIDASIEVGTRPNTAVFISVVDDGPGIDPEFLPRIFEKFEKSSFSSGTGLGLYMARMVVEAIMGSVSVQSSPEGTTFQLALPVSSVRSPAGTPR